MVRLCFLGLMGLFFSTGAFAQLSPTKTTTPRTAQSIEDEINGVDLSSKSRDLKSFASGSIAGRLSDVALKYASLLNILPSMLSPNIRLLEAVDEWYGTRYRYGGTTKSGIDCSAFVRSVYKMAFGIDLPRTAREQYRVSDYNVKRADLKEGDLVFFNTRGGVSHVGVYLGNSKFAHASSSRGVVVSSLNEKYYAARYLGAGRMEKSGTL